ncbi:glycosyltransferase [Desulfosediminicola ganghwensis]|uniref:glycosyltransferase n=1 Tax=Desulfosediminicola ganghwensis TaxID=2569540 RepID=UPI0010ADA0A2|nr:glycosyltransferase family 2 protein [Desulfosediminicola ganghwensis]
MSLLLILACAIFLVQLFTFVHITLGLRTMEQLHRMVLLKNYNSLSAPKVSVIVPACNEAETIRPALKRLLAQQYQNLEIIVVNDRSTDRTSEIVREIQKECRRDFELLEITELPDGWLGKANALQVGAEKASGEILLFTDADVEMEPTTIARAVQVLESRKIDHLSLIFQHIGGNWLLNALILDSACGLLAMFKPWKAGDRSSSFGFGVGAFNMVRSTAYRAVGGHSRIRMQPIDDLMLGKELKANGFRQLCMLGRQQVMVCWYPSVKAMVDGLMKNVFSVLHYRAWLAVVVAVLIFVGTLLPVAAIFFTSGVVQLVFTAAVLTRIIGLLVTAGMYNMGPGVALGGLISPFLSIYIVLRAMVLVTRDSGIYWRNSYYPLDELKKSKPVIF